MTQATPKRSALILVAQSTLTAEQRNKIKDDIRAELPVDVGVIVLDPALRIGVALPVAE